MSFLRWPLCLYLLISLGCGHIGRQFPPVSLDTTLTLSVSYYPAIWLETGMLADTLSAKGTSDRVILPFSFNGIRLGRQSGNILFVANDSQILIQVLDTGRGELAFYDADDKPAFRVVINAQTPRYWDFCHQITQDKRDSQENYSMLNYPYAMGYYINQGINKQVPSFSLRTIEGRWFSNKDLTGKITIINFTHLGCIGCIGEQPELNDLYDQYKEDNEVLFLAITSDSGFVKDGAYIVSNGMMESENGEPYHTVTKPWPSTISYTTCINRPESMARVFYALGDPATFIIDAHGIVRYAYSGYSFPANGRRMEDALKTSIDLVRKIPMDIMP